MRTSYPIWITYLQTQAYLGPFLFLLLGRVNPKKMTDIQRKIQAHLASDMALKESAQRAFQSYLKSVYLLKNKHVFDVFKLDTTTFANSLGLAIPPRVRFLERQLKSKAEAKDKPAALNKKTRLVSDSEGKDHNYL